MINIKDVIGLYKEHFGGVKEASSLTINGVDCTIKFALVNYNHKSTAKQFIIMSFLRRLTESGYSIKRQSIQDKIERFRGGITYFTFEYIDQELEKRVTRPSMRILLGLNDV